MTGTDYLKSKGMTNCEWGLRIRIAERHGGSFPVERALYLDSFPDDFKRAVKAADYLEVAKLLYKYRKQVKGCFYKKEP